MIPRIGQRVRDPKRPSYIGEVTYVGPKFIRVRRDDDRVFQVTPDRCHPPGIRMATGVVLATKRRVKMNRIRRMARELRCSRSAAREFVR